MKKIELMESLYLLILIFFIILITFPLGFKIKIFYSVKNNRGAVAVYFWKIKIKVLKVKFKGKQIYLVENHKQMEKEIELTEPQLKFLQFWSNEVKDKIKLRSLNGYLRIGVDNPFYASLLSAGATDLLIALFAYIKRKRPSANFRLKTHTSFTEFNCIFAFNSKISLSILDIIYSFIMSILRTRTDRIFEDKIFLEKNNY